MAEGSHHMTGVTETLTWIEFGNVWCNILDREGTAFERELTTFTQTRPTRRKH